MVSFVTFLESTKDCHGVFDTGLSDEHLLEATLECGVLLNELAIFIQGGGTDQAQFTTSKHGLEHVGCCHGAFASASTHQGVEFIDEGNDLTIRVIDFFEDCLEAFFKFASILCTCNEGRDVEGDKLLVLEAVGDVTGDNALGESFHDSSLSHAWFTDQHGVVLGTTSKHLADSTDLRIATDDGVELAALCNFGEVDTVKLERALVFFLRLLLHVLSNS